MANYKTSFNMKTRYLLGLASLLLVATVCVAFSLRGNDDFDVAKQGVLLRNIGHQVLLHSGDSTSRVLPVIKTAEDEYQITFENEFTFQTDSLVKIIRQSLAKDKLADDYIVNVLNCTNKNVVFGYGIFKTEKENIVPCSGRKQPKGCYLINVKFQHASISPLQKGYLIASFPLLAFIGLVISRSVRERKGRVENLAGTLTIGNTLFDTQKRTLLFAENVTELTAKENKLLLIFAQAPNTAVERSRLQKEIWEDEGVIVGRSLDMFISKLRKKLEHDSSIQITNIHGKGYKLEISG